MTNQERKQLVNQLLPDNTTGEISAKDVRDVQYQFSDDIEVAYDNANAAIHRIDDLELQKNGQILDSANDIKVPTQTISNDPAVTAADNRLVTIANAFAIEVSLKDYIEQNFIDKHGQTKMDTTFNPSDPKDVTTKEYVDTHIPDKAAIDALGIDAATVNGKAVETAVPANAVFTDTVYDDTQVKADIAANTTKIDANAAEITNLKKVGQYKGTYPDETMRDTFVPTPQNGDYVLIGHSAPYQEQIFDGVSNKWENAGISQAPAGVVVEDSLTSTSNTNALSANQGKILNDKVMSHPEHYHGTGDPDPAIGKDGDLYFKV